MTMLPESSLVLLNTSRASVFRSQNLQMARLTDEEQTGQKSYLKVENGQPVLYLTEDFKIECPRCNRDADNPNRATRNRGCAGE